MKYISLFILTFTLLLLPIYSMNNNFSSSELDVYAEKALPQMPNYPYPYNDLYDRLTKEEKKVFPLFAYGSLIDKDSAKRTLSAEALASRKPAIAFGVKRVFDRDVPVASSSSNRSPPCDPNSRGMLNVQKTETQDEFINGVLIQLPVSDIPALLKREVGYDLVPVVVADWDALMAGKVEYSTAYILLASKGSQYVNSTINPRPGYYELTRDAAKEFGPLYELIWFKTTYMPDGYTPISAWEQLVEKGDPRTCIQNPAQALSNE